MIYLATDCTDYHGLKSVSIRVIRGKKIWHNYEIKLMTDV